MRHPLYPKLGGLKKVRVAQRQGSAHPRANPPRGVRPGGCGHEAPRKCVQCLKQPPPRRSRVWVALWCISFDVYYPQPGAGEWRRRGATARDLGPCPAPRPASPWQLQAAGTDGGKMRTGAGLQPWTSSSPGRVSASSSPRFPSCRRSQARSEVRKELSPTPTRPEVPGPRWRKDPRGLLRALPGVRAPSGVSPASFTMATRALGARAASRVGGEPLGSIRQPTRSDEGEGRPQGPEGGERNSESAGRRLPFPLRGLWVVVAGSCRGPVAARLCSGQALPARPGRRQGAVAARDARRLAGTELPGWGVQIWRSRGPWSHSELTSSAALAEDSSEQISTQPPPHAHPAWVSAPCPQPRSWWLSAGSGFRLP